MASTDELHAEQEYLRLYAEYTDTRVKLDPKEAVGGLWDEIGQLQFGFLVEQGLKPSSSLLEIGCGTLRGGRHTIRYLEPHRFVGLDISKEAIVAAERLVVEEGLAEKGPQLIANAVDAPLFKSLSGHKFDFVVAHSVFTHLPGKIIDEVFSSLGQVTRSGSRFYFTYFPSAFPTRSSAKTFSYPPRFFESVAARYGFATADMSAQYPHPRGQIMAMAYPSV